MSGQNLLSSRIGGDYDRRLQEIGIRPIDDLAPHKGQSRIVRHSRARAREARVHALVIEAIEIADDGRNDAYLDSKAGEESTVTTFGGASCACGSTSGFAQGWRRTSTATASRSARRLLPMRQKDGVRILPEPQRRQ